ncbi:MAG: hypothetical protein RIQ79_111 [Verrucomicrobiota bacterium]
MAKKPNLTALTFRDLVLGAEADVLRQALEARVRIDDLIAERQAAYERIATLETQIEDVIGEPGVFPFPAPPLPVAGLDPKADTVTRSAGAPATVKKSLVREPAAPPPPEADDDDSSDDEAPAAEETDTDA